MTGSCSSSLLPSLTFLRKPPLLSGLRQFISHKICSQKLPEADDCQTHFYLFLIIPEVSRISAETSYARCLHQAFWFDSYFNWTFSAISKYKVGGKRSYFTQIKPHLVQDDVAFPCSDILQKNTNTCSNPLFFLFLILLHYLISYCMLYFLDPKFKITPATPTIQIRNLLPKARNFF